MRVEKLKGLLEQALTEIDDSKKNMGWVCNECGNTTFYREQKVKYNANAEIIDAENGDVICLECGIRGDDIIDIAEYEEIEE